MVILEADITDSVAVEVRPFGQHILWKKSAKLPIYIQEVAKAVESATGGTLDYLIIVAALATNMNKPILAL